MPSSGASTRCPTPSAPKKSKTSAAGSAASCRRANLLYSRTRVPRPMRPLTLSLSPSGGEGIETTPSPSPRERAGVRVALSSRIGRLTGARAGLQELRAQVGDLLGEGDAAARGHRRLLGQAGVQLDEDRSLGFQQLGQPGLEILDVLDGAPAPP